MIKAYDIVVAERNLSEKVPRGTAGTVVMVYLPGSDYEVEFTDNRGETLDFLTVKVPDISLMPDNEVAEYYGTRS